MLKKKLNNYKILRLIDANSNRLREGLRVVEDILRFILDDEKLTAKLKIFRHKLTRTLNKATIIKSLKALNHRQINKDVGKKTIKSENIRFNVKDIFMANAQRIKESTRVLEEFFKLYNLTIAEDLKKLRYNFYDLEQKIITKILDSGKTKKSKL
ncbi:MAG: thiamine-phosphate pyrophosphorylase [Candidatus Omnitrophota bacterium]